MGPTFKIEFKVQFKGGAGAGVLFMDRSVRLFLWPFMLRIGCWW